MSEEIEKGEKGKGKFLERWWFFKMKPE